MGTSHAVIPAADIEPWGDPSGYFSTFGITLPPSRPPSRRPTKSDLDAVLAELPHRRIEVSRTDRGLNYDIPDSNGGGSWAVIWVTEYHGDDSAPVELYFHRGDPDLVLDIAGRLSVRCGPILIMINNQEPHLIGV